METAYNVERRLGGEITRINELNVHDIEMLRSYTYIIDNFCPYNLHIISAKITFSQLYKYFSDFSCLRCEK